MGGGTGGGGRRKKKERGQLVIEGPLGGAFDPAADAGLQQQNHESGRITITGQNQRESAQIKDKKKKDGCC